MNIINEEQHARPAWSSAHGTAETGHGSQSHAPTHRAAQTLVGLRDFTTFRSVHCQSDSPVKTLDRLAVERDGEEVRIHAEARSFLHHQVRSMVGCLALVGMGRWDEARVGEALAKRTAGAALIGAKRFVLVGGAVGRSSRCRRWLALAVCSCERCSCCKASAVLSQWSAGRSAAVKRHRWSREINYASHRLPHAHARCVCALVCWQPSG